MSAIASHHQMQIHQTTALIEIICTAGFVVLSGILGAMFNQAGWGVAGGLALLLVWHWLQAKRLFGWLVHKEKHLPEKYPLGTTGFWRGLSTKIHNEVFGDNQHLVLLKDRARFQRLETMRQDFVANVSHELRTPLTSILGYLETLSSGSDLTPDTIRTMLPKMENPARRMQALVEDLLLLSRLDSTANPRPADMLPIAIADMISSIISEVSSIAGDNHEFLVDADADLLLLSVESEIRSAFSNLITNAIRYSPDGGQVQVHWHLVGKNARFEVKDQGIGIAPNHLSRLTERFYRVDTDRSRIKGGTGLGLAIVKHVLRRHNSELEITSSIADGKAGSSFSCAFKSAHVRNISPPDRTEEVAGKVLRK